jgi:hypothetical protein
MMRWFTVMACALFSSFSVFAQITITESDMPVHGDELWYSNATTALGTGYAADSGANMTWNYDLTASSQGVDVYKKPAEVNPLFAFTISNPSCYGYKIADSIPGISLIASGVTISDLYTFYSTYVTPRCFAAEAFGAKIAGFPVGATYNVPDAVYMFPLTYHRSDSSDFHLNFGAATFGSIEQKGYRKTRVDGWGTITTPYFTTPVNCIRVRSELNEIDSVDLSGTSFGIPRVTIEYKWLVKGEHYPALYVSAISVAGNEIVTSTRYRDSNRSGTNASDLNHTTGRTEVYAYPNPATTGQVTFELPDTWKEFYIELFDAQGKAAGVYANTKKLDISHLPSGNYIARITSGRSIAYTKIVR